MTYATHIAEATARFMESHPRALLMGAGVTDVKHCYGTTALAHEQFPDRVLETPLSETMLTGACVGLAENGYVPIFVHQRADFSTLSVEHLVNTAAKHRYLFGHDVPMMVRMVIGQGWGCGVSHTQNFAHWFANVPGLDVHMPVTRWAIDDAFDALDRGRTVVMVEHRRLYETDLNFKYAWAPHEAVVNLFPVSAAAIDAGQAAEQLWQHYRVMANVWPVQQLNGFVVPEDWIRGVPAIVVDCGPQLYGPSAEIAAQLYDAGASKVTRISPPAYPCPASAPLEAAWYPSAADIVNAALQALGRKERVSGEQVNHVPAGQGAF